VSQISPYLDHLLTRWIEKGNELRKEADFQKDLIEPLVVAANGNRLAMRERRRRDLRELEEAAQATQTRWDERLHRIEEWKNVVGNLQNEEAKAQSLLRSTLWLQKARRHQDAFTRWLERRADSLHTVQQALHERLTNWIALLQERENSLQELINKQEKAERTVYVSRSRKQPEVDFVREQRTVSDALGTELNHLRRSLHHALGRLQKAFDAVEHQASGSEILFEVHKREIVEGLKSSEKILRDRREDILSDALTYETCRNILRRLQETAQGLRCIEDIPHSSKRGWKKFFQIR
jgi:chromosome segregation ATPase